MSDPIPLPPPHEPIATTDGKVNEVWYRYFSQNAGAVNDTSATALDTIFITTPTTWTVGTTGDYQSVGDAFNAALQRRPGAYQDVHNAASDFSNHNLLSIRLLSGYQWNKAIQIDGGVDLGWVEVVSDDATVAAPIDTTFPLLKIRGNTVGPQISCALDMATATSNSAGIVLENGARMFSNGSSNGLILNAKNNALDVTASEFTGFSCIISRSGASGYVVDTNHGAIVRLRGANISGGNKGIRARDCCVVDVDEAVALNGIDCVGGYVSAINAVASSTIDVDDGGIIMAARITGVTFGLAPNTLTTDGILFYTS